MQMNQDLDGSLIEFRQHMVEIAGQLREVRNRLQEELDDFDRRRGQTAQALENLVRAISMLDASVSEESKSGATPIKRARRSRVRGAIEQVLKVADGPMHADQIMSAVAARGVQLSQKDPKATVVTALLRMRADGEVVLLGQNVFEWVAAEGLESASREGPAAQ